MSTPSLLAAIAHGQTAVRIFYSEAMREVSETSPFDPRNPLMYTPGLGLPAISSVVSISPLEFEIRFASTIPLGTGYTITAAGSLQSAAGSAISGVARIATFDVVARDLLLSNWVWMSSTRLDLIFNDSLLDFPANSALALVAVTPVSRVVRRMEPSDLDLTGPSTVSITFSNPGSLGAKYAIKLVRESFRSVNGQVLKSGEEAFEVFGQGQRPSLISPFAASANEFAVSSSEAFWFPDVANPEASEVGWPLSVLNYTISPTPPGQTLKQTLGASISRPGPDTIQFDSSKLAAGAAVFRVRQLEDQLTAGVSWLSEAKSVTGAGTQSLVSGETRFTKTAGSPYALSFALEPKAATAHTPRQLDTAMRFTLTGGDGDAYPVLTLTFANLPGLRLVVVKEEGTAGTGYAQFFYGTAALSAPSMSWTLTSEFQISVVDSALPGTEVRGYRRIALEINGSCLLGMEYAALPVAELTKLMSSNRPNFEFGITLGHADFNAKTFTVAFSEDLQLRSFISHNFFGKITGDLLDFDSAQSTATVAASASDSGDPAFGAFAEYSEENDCVQVLISLSDLGANFASGSVQLQSGAEVLDEIVFSSEYLLRGARELVSYFNRPARKTGLRVFVELNVGSDVYAGHSPVHVKAPDILLTLLTRQARSWSRRVNRPTPELLTEAGPSINQL